ncbi:MAG: tetratricopeptide repeat protein [Aquificaceae bacterium]
MRSLEGHGIRLIVKKILVLLLIFLLSFSAEREKSNLKLAQTYFYRGYIEYTQGNYSDAIGEFSKSYLADKEGYYGELSYLYIGIAYAQLSYKKGQKGGIASAIAYLNMYPYYYKKPTYLFLQREFIGYSYLLLGLYDKAKDIFLSLYKDTLRQDYLLNFLYADALSDGTNRELLNMIDPRSLTEKRYLYHLVKGFYAFRDGNYKETIKELSEAQSLNRYIEDDPEFLYRYAVSAFMEGDWRKAVFYFEQLDRKDMYRKYGESLDYYLALIYLMNKNYADAKRRVDKLMELNNVKTALLISQLWTFPDFLEKYKFNDYKKTLKSIAWRYLNSSYSIPAILGLYYYSLRDKKIEEESLFKLKNLDLKEEIVFQDIKVNTRPMLELLKGLMDKMDPYGKDANFLISLYSLNKGNYALLFGYEKLARAITYLGNTSMKDVVQRVEEPLRSFLLGQISLLEGSEEGLRMIESASKLLEGEDKKEALFIIGIYKKDIRLLESLLSEKLSPRLEPYLEPSLLELGDFYYARRDYNKAKEYYKKYLEIAQESYLYWLVAYKLAKAGELTKDQETISWVVKKAEMRDNIISRVILALWG